jgi:hypothetical protein
MLSPNINQNPMPSFHILPRLEAVGAVVMGLLNQIPLVRLNATVEANRGAEEMLSRELES